MPIRTATAEWEGALIQGHGAMQLGSGAFHGSYSFASRFEDAPGTNPEELIAAAHAGCFSMALAAMLSAAGFTPSRVQTSAQVHIVKDGDGFTISEIQLDTHAVVPGMEPDAFQQYAQDAKKGCPVSKALAAVPRITLTATLE